MVDFRNTKSLVLPNCLKCVFFKVSWDEHKPRQCNYFNFKSKDMPSHVVFQASGMVCPHFQQKKASSI